MLSVVFLIPIYWMVVSSFRPQGELFADITNLSPTDLTLDNYVRLFQEQPYARWFFNSVTQSLGFAGAHGRPLHDGRATHWRSTASGATTSSSSASWSPR